MSKALIGILVATLMAWLTVAATSIAAYFLLYMIAPDFPKSFLQVAGVVLLIELLVQRDLIRSVLTCIIAGVFYLLF